MSIKTDFKIDKLGPVTIMEPKVKTKIKFLQKIFIKLFGYKEVCRLNPNDITEIRCDDKIIYRQPVREITFTADNAKWDDDFLNEIRKEEYRRK